MWSSELAQVAQRHADRCQFQLNSQRTEEQTTFDYVGENFVKTTSSAPDLAGLVRGWYNEEQNYNYETNSCSAVCDQYKQVGLLGRNTFEV